MKYVIFDDHKWENFFPLTLTRSTGDLRVGILKLRQRLSAYFELTETNLIVFSGLAKIYRERHPSWKINRLPAEDTIFINSRLQIDEELAGAVRNLEKDRCLVYRKEILAFRTRPKITKISSEEIEQLYAGLEKIKWQRSAFWNNIWELIAANETYISRDFQDFFYDKDNYFETEPCTTVLNPYNVWRGEGVRLAPGVVLDATKGPIVLDENVSVMPNAVLQGPVYVGKNSLIKIGAQIYAGTSIGPHCVVGGEMSGSIIQAFSEIPQAGFWGQSYLGEWISIGAGSCCSEQNIDLEAVYMYFYPKNRKEDTKLSRLGTVIGDHSRTGINVSLDQGCVIGVGCCLTNGSAGSDHITSFHGGSLPHLKELEFNIFRKTAKAVKKPKNMIFTANEKELYNNIRQLVLNDQISGE